MSGAWVAGFLNSVLFVVLAEVFVKLGEDYPSFERIFGFLDNLSDVMPALLAITVARNPSGIVSLVIDGFAVFRQPATRPYLALVVAAQAALWAAAVNGAIGNWTLALVSIGLWVGAGRHRREPVPRRRDDAHAAGGEASRGRANRSVGRAARSVATGSRRGVRRGARNPAWRLPAAGGASAMSSLLEVEDVTVLFGGNAAVSDVTLDAEVGRITGLIGPTELARRPCSTS